MSIVINVMYLNKYTFFPQPTILIPLSLKEENQYTSYYLQTRINNVAKIKLNIIIWIRENLLINSKCN